MIGRVSGPHWSKDYVEHLRTIHFSLIALCLGAIVIAFSAGPSEIQQARKEIAAIQELTKEWKSDWIQSQAEALVNAEKQKPEGARSIDPSHFDQLPQPKNRSASITLELIEQERKFLAEKPNIAINDGQIINSIKRNKFPK